MTVWRSLGLRLMGLMELRTLLRVEVTASVAVVMAATWSFRTSLVGPVLEPGW